MKFEHEIADLQSRIIFQEREIGELNAALIEQKNRLDALELQLRELHKQYQTLGDQAADRAHAADEKPPHY